MKKINLKVVIAVIAIIAICLSMFFLSQCSNKGSTDDSHKEETQRDTVHQTDLPVEIMPTPNPEVYNNNNILSSSDSNGGTLSIGVINTEANTINGLIIAPRYESSKLQSDRVGYYIESSYRASLETSDKEYFNINDEKHKDIHNIYIDWTQDHAMSSEFEDLESYGIKWFVYSVEPNLTDEISISVIDVYTYDLLADYTLVVSEVDGKLEFTKLYSNDIFTAEEKNEDFDELVNRAVKDLKSIDIIKSDDELRIDKASCSLLDKPRHMYFLGFDGETKVSARYNNIIAVNIPAFSPTIGFYTVYYDNKVSRIGLLGLDYYWTRTDEDILSRIEQYGFTSLHRRNEQY